MASEPASPTLTVKSVERVTIRFAGDSGDGSQLIGNRFTEESAVFGNDVSTLPDFPAEIRAPAGSLPGVSGFQVSFASGDIHTPGDKPDLLVAMNPAALKTNLGDVEAGSAIIVNIDAFNDANFEKAGYATNPIEDGSLEDYTVFPVPITSLTKEAVKDLALSRKSSERPRNFFALGLALWLYDRPMETTLEFIRAKFAKNEDVAQANSLALKAGYNYGATVELFTSRYSIDRATLPAGRYRNIRGNQALALGFVAAARQAGRDIFYGSYPITPASEILEELAALKAWGVRTLQAEDEIAAVCSAIGASFGGGIGITGTSGPGLALKSEGIGLAVMAELPLVIVNVQRAGPSTGMPTKPEQSDLLQAMFGRNGESPVAVLAARSPGDCFRTALEAVRLAIRHMTPVIVLSDMYLASSSEPWRIPNVADLPSIEVPPLDGGDEFRPYGRDEETLARPWAVPGQRGREHRIGGLEKEEGSGDVSYDPENHRRMVELRASKIDRIADDLPELTVHGPDEGDLLILGWGSTWGAIHSAAAKLAEEGLRVGYAGLRHLNPFPKNLGEVLRRYRKVLVPELNSGQLSLLIRAEFLVDAIPFPKVAGRPFLIGEIEDRARELLEEVNR